MFMAQVLAANIIIIQDNRPDITITLRLPVDWREIVWRIRSDIIGKREDFRRVDEYCFSIIYYINLLCTFVEKSF